ncbi:MAG: hypothetical protein HY235_30565 [Acidobacteria bacterium]|nr:hypothetical protein [Acidobacteriota bacterium]
MHRILILCLGAAAVPVFGQMSADQKLLDFQQLAALYAKQYAPYEWKRDALRVDLLKLAPWIERVNRTKDDFEFLETCAEYVSSLRDGHSQFFTPSNFFADSGLFVDWYEGKAIIDVINRLLLPASLYPFEVGDEVLAVDGKTPEEWTREMQRFVAAGNPRAATRDALDLMVFRPQYAYPRAHQTPQKSRFLLRRQNGLTESFDIEWFKQGEPLTVIGPVPSPFLRAAAGQTTAIGSGVTPELDLAGRPFRGLPELRRAVRMPLRAVKGVGSILPLFAMPAGFQQRLGRGRDLIFSGTIPASNLRIGFIRVGWMFDPQNPFLESQALSQLVGEISFMQRNTDGLIVDIMRNPGGDVCFAQDLASLMTTERFTMAGGEIRATREWISRYENLISELEFAGVDKWVVDILKAMLGDIRGAYRENRGRTGALPLCDIALEVEPARDNRGNLLGYSRPLMLLVDDYTASAAEIFAAAIQDNRRGIVLGVPTMGAGGVVSSPLPTGWYSETAATVTQALLVRPRNIISKDYPAAPYLENIGIQPEVTGDIMTVDNLRNGGRRFVQSFMDAMVEHIRGR